MIILNVINLVMVKLLIPLNCSVSTTRKKTAEAITSLTLAPVTLSIFFHNLTNLPLLLLAY